MFNFRFWDPDYQRRHREALQSDPNREMGYLEVRHVTTPGTHERLGSLGVEGALTAFVATQSVFSFVFGDGDPNAEFEALRWATVGDLIRRSGSVVTAEQLAPLLEPPPPLGRSDGASLAGASAFADESFVLPALTRFGGEAEVTPAGGIVYRFPDLRATGALPQADAGSNASTAPPTALSERSWEFSEAGAAKITQSLLLGATNAAGVLYLTYLMGTPEVVAQTGASTMAALGMLLPPLQAYALLFFALPAARWLGLQGRNAAIEARNDARRAAVRLLEAPPPAVAAKMLAARSGAGRVVVSDDRVVFSSDAGDAAAATAQLADEAAGFERRLGDPSGW